MFRTVGSRLLVLVVVEAWTAIVLLGLGVVGLVRVAEASAYTYRFVVPPLMALSAALEHAGTLARRSDLDLAARRQAAEEIRGTVAYYRAHWLLAESPSEDVQIFVGVLRRMGRTSLIEAERQAIEAADEALARLEAGLRAEPPDAVDEDAAKRLTAALHELSDLNVEFVEVAQLASFLHARRLGWALVALGAVGILVAVLLGLAVRGAIAPRIRRLVVSVRRFQELGVHEPLQETAGDEITVLSNAIDAGFAAIIARDRERERFLAVVAHELKTPVTSVRGFAEAALRHPEDRGVRERALDVIGRQSLRLARLVDELLLATRARMGELSFAPAPMDLAALARRVASEVSAVRSEDRIVLESPQEVHMLGDASLLAHSLWSLYSHAAAISSGGHPLTATIRWEPPRVSVTVRVPRAALTSEELVASMGPFATVQFEGGERRRHAIGLYLTREIARVHGGALRVVQADESVSLVLDLPA